MADREIVGRCTCPICGLPSQDVRVNINQKLYGYCDNGCAYKFNSAQSRKFLPELRAGRNVATSNGIMIFSTKNKELVKNEEQKRVAGNAGGNAGAGNNTLGRPTGNIAGNAGAGNVGGNGGRPWLSWLTAGDDDDDDE